MRHHAENTTAQLLLETVHDRQHHDQGHDTEGDAEHRDQRNERDEVITALGSGVAQPDKYFQRQFHARD